MSDREKWRQSSGEVAEAPIPGGSGSTYPLLGDELPDQAHFPQPVWTVRLVLRESYPAEQMEALSQGVSEILSFSALGAEGQPLESVLEVRVADGQARVRADLSLLRNVAEIRRLRALHHQVHSWTLLSEGENNDDPEALVGETLRQLAGVLGGCHTIEIRQGDGESFNALWSRLNVARLMATEGELDGIPDPISGSGLFAELQARL